MVRLTAELILQSPQYTNPVRDRQLDLRGYLIPVIENMGATLDQFDTIDLCENVLRKLDGFPLLKRLKCLLLINNRIGRIAENLQLSLPNLERLVLTNNDLRELGDLDPLTTVKTLQHLSLIGNPITTKKMYRLYVINKIPQLKVLDFQKVKLKEREEAAKVFKGKKGSQLVKDLGKRANTFTPGSDLPEAKKTRTEQDVEAIKAEIANASTLEEVERLSKLLQAGYTPGMEARKNGTSGN